MTIKLYGIKNCDTVKKTLNWLDSHGISYDFHNYKKQGLDDAAFQTAIDQHGWDIIINKRGTSWRQLDEATKNNVNDDNAITIARDNPSLVKRPLLIKDGIVYVGFKEKDYKEIFSI